MRDDEKMSFVAIAAKLGVSPSTVTRAYDHLRPETVRKAVENGTSARRGQVSRLGEEVIQKIREQLEAGTEAKEIAKQLGCGTSTVYRVRRKMNAEANQDQAT